MTHIAARDFDHKRKMPWSLRLTVNQGLGIHWRGIPNMSIQTVHDADAAINIAPLPSWHTAPGWTRDALDDFDLAGTFHVTDFAPLVTSGTVSVGIEWSTQVRADGSVTPPMQALKLSGTDESMYIDTREVKPLIEAICLAAAKAGVVLL